MLNIPELEKRWLTYKIKSFIPYLIIAISLVIISIVLYFILTKDEKENNTKRISDVTPSAIIEQKVIINEKEKDLLITNKPSLTYKESLTTEKEKISLKPSLNFMKEMQNSSQPYYENDDTESQQEIKSKITQKAVVKHPVEIKVPTAETEDKVIDEQVINSEPHEEINKVNIKRKNAKNDIQEIINRFKKNNNPALSLFVAKKYYELGDYHQSYNYALITNEINRDIEASWIIFSKSLVKLGEKDMAIKTLKEYSKQSNSESAKLLLNEIMSGKFK